MIYGEAGDDEISARFRTEAMSSARCATLTPSITTVLEAGTDVGFDAEGDRLFEAEERRRVGEGQEVSVDAGLGPDLSGYLTARSGIPNQVNLSVLSNPAATIANWEGLHIIL